MTLLEKSIAVQMGSSSSGGGAIEWEMSLTTIAISCIATPPACCACAMMDNGCDHLGMPATDSGAEGGTFCFARLILVSADVLVVVGVETVDGEKNWMVQMMA